MADGLNDARAMRVVEIMTGYTAIQNQLAALQAQHDQMDASTPGAVILRQCLNEGRALLMKPVPNFANPPSPGEETKVQLQNVVLDAASRRFRAYRLYKRAQCAITWWNRRQQVLQGKAPSPQTNPALSKVDNALRTDIVAITDAKVFQELNALDVQAGNWTGEMPPLPRIQQYNQQHP